MVKTMENLADRIFPRLPGPGQATTRLPSSGYSWPTASATHCGPKVPHPVVCNLDPMVFQKAVTGQRPQLARTRKPSFNLSIYAL